MEDLAAGTDIGIEAYLCGVAPFYCLKFSHPDSTPLFLLRVKADTTAADPLMTVTVYMSSDIDGSTMTVAGLLGRSMNALIQYHLHLLILIYEFVHCHLT